MYSLTLALAVLLSPTVFAATAEQWRGRSIYQIITDRFALPEGSDLTACDPGEQTWCGGTWSTIRDNLDYIQNAGFTAIWISPINQNYEGERSEYGDPYHGYWIADATKLNDRFGTEDDLKALIADLHQRDMYIMVDVVVNNVMATSTTPDYSKYMFKDESLYHPYCPIEWGNVQSEENCWMGDEKVPLPDVDTSNPTVISTYNSWIKDLVAKYEIDGLRIDAAKHVQADFWPEFCASAGVFCIGEVFGDDVGAVAQYQGPMDSVLNFPMYAALVKAFAIPGDGNVTAITSTLEESKKQFKDLTVLGNFLENQDLSRWRNFSVDVQSLHNAMTFNFMSDGIPIVYYGQEQGFSGIADPFNREPLWPSNYEPSPTYDLISQLNQLRNYLINTTDWTTSPMEVLTSSEHGLAMIKGGVISILTNIGSPPQDGTQISVQSPYESSTSTTNILTCQQFVVGSRGHLDVEYTKGGRPVVLVPSEMLEGSQICTREVDATHDGNNVATDSGAKTISQLAISSIFCLVLSMALLSSWLH